MEKKLKPRKKNKILEGAIEEKFGSQKAFSEVIGIDPSLISRTISYRWNLTNDEKKLWAKVLEKNMDELFV